MNLVDIGEPNIMSPAFMNHYKIFTKRQNNAGCQSINMANVNKNVYKKDSNTELLCDKVLHNCLETDEHDILHTIMLSLSNLYTT